MRLEGEARGEDLVWVRGCAGGGDDVGGLLWLLLLLGLGGGFLRGGLVWGGGEEGGGQGGGELFVGVWEGGCCWEGEEGGYGEGDLGEEGVWVWRWGSLAESLRERGREEGIEDVIGYRELECRVRWKLA